MGTIHVSDEARAIVERAVQAGQAPSETAFVDRAVHLFAQALQLERETLFAAIDEGRRDIAAGHYTDLSSPEEIAAFMDSVWADASEDEAQRKAEPAIR